MNTAPHQPHIQHETRGVVREAMAPVGYIGYVAVSKDGEPISFFRMRQELYTDWREARAIDAMWALLQEWESMHDESLPLPDTDALRPRLVRE